MLIGLRCVAAPSKKKNPRLCLQWQPFVCLRRPSSGNKWKHTDQHFPTKCGGSKPGSLWWQYDIHQLWQWSSSIADVRWPHPQPVQCALINLYLSAFEFTVYNTTMAFPAAPLKTTPFSPQEERSKAGLFSSIHLPNSTPRCVSDADADAIWFLYWCCSFFFFFFFIFFFFLFLLFSLLLLVLILLLLVAQADVCVHYDVRKHLFFQSFEASPSNVHTICDVFQLFPEPWFCK